MYLIEIIKNLTKLNSITENVYDESIKKGNNETF